MNFYVMTLFPEMIESVLKSSITGRAIEKGLIGLQTVNIRNYAQDRYRHVDDYPYGGGAGMIMQPGPIYDCWQDIVKNRTQPIRVIYTSPAGKVFCQEDAKELSREENLIFLCGHYEGVDERILEEIVTDQYSIGDYVLTGGELPAMVMIDAISRMIPGVLSNEDSPAEESFQNGLLEYPQYTRPEVFHGRKVPEVLLSGHHARIDAWRHEQSLERTWQRRPDLLKKQTLCAKDQEYLEDLKEKSTE